MWNRKVKTNANQKCQSKSGWTMLSLNGIKSKYMITYPITCCGESKFVLVIAPVSS